MNAAHIHLMLYHLPIGALLAGVAVLLGGRISGNESVQRAALCLLVAGGMLALPAHLTGDPASELVQKLPGIQKEVIEAHEFMGHLALGACLATGVFAGSVLWITRGGRLLGRAWFAVLMVMGVLALGILSIAAWRGGRIRHGEFSTPLVAKP